ncbi:MAG TPA: glycosyltransferase family 1 protein [bacterium]|nr:glycosyltransferase family 1 protein [bacterium]
MKIGIDIRVLLDKNYSGVASFTLQLLKNLIKVDRRNAYYFFYNSFKKANIPFLSKKISTKKTRYPNKIFNYFLQKIFNHPKLDKIIGGSDIFYLPHLNFASFSKNSKNIITIHDLSFLRYPEFFSFRKNFWHWALNIKKNIKKFDKIVAVSQNTKNDLIELLNVPETKIEVVYPGISEKLTKFQGDSHNSIELLKEKYDLNKDFILYLGTIEPRKNISGLIEAYNQLRDEGFDVLLVLAGGWGWRTKQIKKDWQNSKYREDIRFIGYIEEENKPFLYKMAKVFVYPSFYEGFGFPPLEAMYFGLPVISSNVSSLPEVLGDSALLVNPDRSNEIFQAIKLILIDEKVRTKLIESGHKQVNKFNWESTAQKYLQVFEEVIKTDYDKK